jgi:hypothetical protein
MEPFEIYIAYVSWGSDGKNRPLLIFLTGNEKVDVYQITTRFDGKSTAIKSKYFKIADWVQAGLDKQSYIDTVTLISLPKKIFKNKPRIGILTENDRKRLIEFLNGQDGL